MLCALLLAGYGRILVSSSIDAFYTEGFMLPYAASKVGGASRWLQDQAAALQRQRWTARRAVACCSRGDMPRLAGPCTLALPCLNCVSRGDWEDFYYQTSYSVSCAPRPR